MTGTRSDKTFKAVKLAGMCHWQCCALSSFSIAYHHLETTGKILYLCSARTHIQYLHFLLRDSAVSVTLGWDFQLISSTHTPPPQRLIADFNDFCRVTV